MGKYWGRGRKSLVRVLASIGEKLLGVGAPQKKTQETWIANGSRADVLVGRKAWAIPKNLEKTRIDGLSRIGPTPNICRTQLTRKEEKDLERTADTSFFLSGHSRSEGIRHRKD